MLLSQAEKLFALRAIILAKKLEKFSNWKRLFSYEIQRLRENMGLCILQGSFWAFIKETSTNHRPSKSNLIGPWPWNLNPKK